VTTALLFSCEHGGARVPAHYRRLFASEQAITDLESHRGSDRGAIHLARALARTFSAPLVASAVTRLLVDVNRSVGHPSLFSEHSRALGPAERKALLERYYFPHRNRVEAWIEEQVRHERRAVHIGVHSFAPRVGRRLRKADVGLLYDPVRRGEKSLCARWKTALLAIDPALRVRRNYPFLGTADGLVTHLRRRFGPERYVGIELEVHESLLATPVDLRQVAKVISQSLANAL